MPASCSFLANPSNWAAIALEGFLGSVIRGNPRHDSPLGANRLQVFDHAIEPGLEIGERNVGAGGLQAMLVEQFPDFGCGFALEPGELDRLVPCRGHAGQRAVEVTLRDTADGVQLDRNLVLAHVSSFLTRSRLETGLKLNRVATLGAGNRANHDLQHVCCMLWREGVWRAVPQRIQRVEDAGFEDAANRQRVRGFGIFLPAFALAGRRLIPEEEVRGAVAVVPLAGRNAGRAMACRTARTSGTSRPVPRSS